MSPNPRQAVFVISIFAAGAALFGASASNDGNLITGSFTQANKHPINNQETLIEEVYWKFDDGTVIEGKIAKYNFTPGKHNITIKIVKSNAETDKYHKTVEIDK
jgi:hypothetical protein